MPTSEPLLRLIMRLQRVQSLVQGRQMLLTYLRKVSNAPLAIVFTFDAPLQALDLLAYSGQRPLLPKEERRRVNRNHLAANGVFGAALHAQASLLVPDLHTDIRALYAERCWTWPGARVLLTPLKANERYGLLVLCFDTPAQNETQDERDALERHSNDLLICSMLLSAYLTGKEEPEQEQQLQQETHATPLTNIHLAQKSHRSSDDVRSLPEMMYSLSSLSELYEMGLALELDEDTRTLYQRVLRHMSKVVRARGACLMLYHPSQQRFFPGATSGEQPPCSTIAATLNGPDLEQQIRHDSGETLLVIEENGERILLITLTYHTTLKGVVALAVSDMDQLLKQRGMLLAYMGNVAALILHNYEMRTGEQKQIIEHERKRIAFDIHDGPAQRITHALQKLDMIRRTLEKPAQSPLPIQPETLLAEINRAYSMLELSLEDLRQSISNLLPAQQEDETFLSMLSTLLVKLREEESGIEVTCQIEKADLLPPVLEGPVFRFIQESINNVRKHANATRITLRIRSVSGSLVVEVSDNGRGFDLERAQVRETIAVLSGRGERLGLRAMRERIEALGGTWEAQSRPGEGTTLRARFPLGGVPVLLTEREREVLHLIVEGMTNRAIAQHLSVSVETIKSHVHHIMQKMQVKDRTQAAVLAARQQWI